MNRILKDGNIILDANNYLESDTFNGLTLVNHFAAKKNKKDGTEEDTVKEQRFYYPKLSMVLSKYLQLKTAEAKSVEELQEIVLRTEKKIEDLKNEHSL